ncbi:MAG: YceI family protein [Phenylobacterium sp.]|nr:YceI family protein [Phenylobacterium sp.]
MGIEPRTRVLFQRRRGARVFRWAPRLLLQRLPVRDGGGRPGLGPRRPGEVETGGLRLDRVHRDARRRLRPGVVGEAFLKSAAFPEATFTSTSFRKLGPTSGQVDGRLALMGQTRPIIFDVKLVGAGSGFGGKPRMGIEAHATIAPKDFGLPPVFDRPIALVIDAEFERTP